MPTFTRPSAINNPAMPVAAAPFIHPRALCESDEIGGGTRVWAFAQVMRGARLGRECNVGGHAFIEAGAVVGDRVTIKNQVMIWEGVTIEDDVFLGPGVVFTNDRYPRSGRMPEARTRYTSKDKWLSPTRVRRGATIGAGAIILCGVTIGPCAMVAAGALVTRDVTEHRLVIGRPARPAGWVCTCGLPLNDQLCCGDCGTRFRHRGEGIAISGS